MVKAIVPFVPSGSQYDESRALFRALGFEELWENDGYAGFQAGTARFILQKYEVKEFAENLMIRLDVEDLDAWWEKYQHLPEQFPGVKMRPPTAFPWGREVHLIDLAGVCWHIG